VNAELLERHGHSIAALRGLARRRLPRLVFDFIDGGAEDERALRRNEDALGELKLLPQPLNGTEKRDQSIELFGQRLSMPVLIGPTGLAGMVWPRGEAHSARAARAADTVYVMSHASTVSMEELAREVGGKLWMQVFVYRDRGLTRSFVERAHAAGYQALVVTIDNLVPGWRERDLRNGFTVPLHLGGRNLFNIASHPGWLLRMSQTPRFTFANYKELEGKSDVMSLAARMGQLLDPGVTWRDMEWLRSIWDRPLLIKGILHPAEAQRAVALGMDGIIVSNHGGRQLDAAPASIEALPGILDALGGKVPVLMDGGIRRGSDVVKTLALGARACLVGRPQLWGLATAGEEGVAWMLACLRNEIDRTMALCGSETLNTVDRKLLFEERRVTQAV
jgi:L-lactate dehydrogenase (cytochrome)/(S)-mandelate dehydrogenase